MSVFVCTVCSIFTLILNPSFSQRYFQSLVIFAMLLLQFLLFSHLEICIINQVVYCIMSDIINFDGLSTKLWTQHSFVSTPIV